MDKLKKITIGIGLFVFLMIVIGAIIGTQMPTTTPPPSPYSMNQTIPIGSMEYKVTDAFTSEYIGTSYVGQEADGIFVIITLEIANNGKDTVHLFANDFKMTDDVSRTFDTSSASIYLSSFGYQPLLFKDLNPGLTTEGSLVFDVPQDSKGLILKVSGTGIFSGTEDVNIGDVSKL